MSAQIERLLIAPIGRLGDHVSQNAMERASSALVERITLAARERLPVAIAEFDVGGLVRKKVRIILWQNSKNWCFQSLSTTSRRLSCLAP